MGRPGVLAFGPPTQGVRLAVLLVAGLPRHAVRLGRAQVMDPSGPRRSAKRGGPNRHEATAPSRSTRWPLLVQSDSGESVPQVAASGYLEW